MESAQTDKIEYIYIDSNDAVAELCDKMQSAGTVAIDIECDSLYHYFEKVCLLQLTFGGVNYLVDTLCGIGVGQVLEVLSRQKILVHCGDYDFRMLRKCYGFLPRGEVFDTWIAARLLGLPRVSLTELARSILKIDLPKSSQKSDWSRRPLSDKQIEYAVKDTCYLEQMADALAEMLEEQGRTQWNQQGVQEMLERASFAEEPEQTHPDKVWRIKGLSKLSTRQLEYVKQLWYWRDGLARKMDRPPFKVMSNSAIVDIAIWASKHHHYSKPVTSIKGVRLPKTLSGKRLETFTRALDTAHKTPESKLPLRRLPIDTSDYDEKYSLLDVEPYQKACSKVAERLGIEPPILVTRAQWYKILIEMPGDIDEIMKRAEILPWKYEYIKEIIEIVEK